MRKALVVGIDDYKSSPLNGCVNDAIELSRILQFNGDKTRNFDTKPIYNIQKKSDLKGLIKELFEGDANTALFYFSGHGFINELGGYIVTPDGIYNDEGISMHEIISIVNKSKIRNKFIILDCCHAGAIGSSNLEQNISNISEGVSILTACQDIQYATEINGHGVFTNLLLDALDGGAADLRGHITPGSIYSYIDQALGPWDQRPVFKTNITRFTSLRTVPPKISLELLRNIVGLFPSQYDYFSLDPSFEFTNNPNIEHKIIEPFSDNDNVKTFKKLKKLQSAGLVEPVEEENLYFTAMNSKSCKLTPLGYHYWRLVKDKRI